MSPELYTEEFRNFRYLKCDAAQVAHYKKIESMLNNVQPWAEVSDPDFRWETRLEFYEQIFDLRWDTIYMVQPGPLYSQDKNTFDWEHARLTEILHPVIYEGHPLMPHEGRWATAEDIPDMENYEKNAHYYLCTHEYINGFAARETVNVDNPGQVYKLDQIPISKASLLPYDAMFYDKAWAQKYQRAITDFLRKNNDAISAISRLF